MTSLSGQHVLITAGPTYEALDPVRFLGNRSSGRLGYALASNALRRGASVTLVSGPTRLSPPQGVQFVPVESAREMLAACQDAAPRANIIIMAAAVADFRPRRVARRKIKKSADSEAPTLELVRNPDILATLCRHRGPGQLIVGFALETDNLLRNAQKKLTTKNCDMIVANSAESISAATQSATIIQAAMPPVDISARSKQSMAAAIWRQIVRSRDNS